MSFISTLIKKIMGDPHAKVIAPFWPIVAQINDLEVEMSPLSDSELQQKTTCQKPFL